MFNKQFEIIKILFLCYFKFLFNGRANKKITNPKRILIVQLAKLGDMVCTTPMFRAIKRKYPKSKVYVIGNKINKDLLDYNNDVDKYMVYSNIYNTINRLKEEGIDFACITGPDFDSLAMLYLFGIPLICVPEIKNGYSPYETKSYKILRKLVVTKSHYMGSYAPKEYLKLLEPIDIFTNNTKKYLFYSKQAKNKINNFFKYNKIRKDDFVVGISPSAGNKIKCWESNKFAKLADYLYKNYNARILIIGGKNDKTEVTNMISALDKKTEVIKCFNIFNIDELKALISRLNCFISVDTGPIYIAESFNVPTIDIVGPIDYKEQPPINKFHKIVVAKRKKPELYVMNARFYNKKEAKRQIDNISVDMVIEKFQELINDLGYKNV